ncbi:MAG: hypothetical protein P4L43_14230 [Syntrophobacteraceae bacterium]|nr:hypothetical protein [Syntrophobacteraceae bacterium]
MVNKIRFFALLLLPVFLLGCGVWGHKDASSTLKPPTAAEIADSPVKFRVVDVSNDTRHVFDVDVIGLLWNGIDESLKQKALLWTPGSGGEPYVLKGHIVEFRERNLGERLLPYMGRTVLKVRVDVSRGGRHVATIESSKTIGYGKGMWTLHAWRKVFAEVSRDVVRQAAEKL